MIFGSLFSGIGGLDLACESVGWRCAWQVEIDPFCRAVLAKHWPDVERYEDVREVGADRLIPVDVIVGGFPCQDVSVAGSRRGLAGERSGLWFDFLRIVEELRPAGVIVENVSGLAGRGLDTVAAGLHGAGYAVEVSRVAAADVGAPHRRIRHFVLGVRDRRVADTAGRRRPRQRQCRLSGGRQTYQSGKTDQSGHGDQCWAAISRLGGGVDGLPAGLVGPGPGGVWPAARGEEQSPWEPPRTISGPRDTTGGRKMRLRALGNAVVPQQGAVAAMRLRELLGVIS